MARLARIVVAGRAHHVTQRGNRREPIFFAEGDQAIYLALLREQAIGGHDTYSPSNLLTVNRYRRQALKDAGEHVCCPPIDPFHIDNGSGPGHLACATTGKLCY